MLFYGWRAWYELPHNIKYLFLIIILIPALQPANLAGAKISLSVVEVIELKTKPLNDIQIYAFEEVRKKWDSSQWYYFNRIVELESGWDNEAQNPKSTAYGIGQFLDSTWGMVGCKKTSDPYKQIDCKIKYLELKYNTPQKAYNFHLQNNWY